MINYKQHCSQALTSSLQTFMVGETETDREMQKMNGLHMRAVFLCFRTQFSRKLSRCSHDDYFLFYTCSGVVAVRDAEPLEIMLHSYGLDY